jgi:P4 family phage/plasmid primase-like protien
MSARALLCPECKSSEGVIFTGNPEFNVDGRPTARCERRNHHGSCSPVIFFTDTCEVVKIIDRPWWERVYLNGTEVSVRSFGAPFLAQKCGAVGIRLESFEGVPEIASNRWLSNLVIDAGSNGQDVLAVPLYHGPKKVGIEVMAFLQSEPRSYERGYSTGTQRKIAGNSGLYVLNPKSNPRAVVIFTGTFDAITAAWDAFEAQNEELAFASAPDGVKAEIVSETCSALFPGVPVVLCSDSDDSGKKARARLQKVAVPIQLTGCTGKDYRASEPSKRWKALLTEVEKAIQVHETAALLGPGVTDKLSPNELGAAFLEGHRLLRDSHGRVYQYKGVVWEERSKEDLDSLICAMDCPRTTSIHRRKEALAFALARVHRAADLRWNNLAASEVPFTNGVLDVCSGQLRSHREADMLETVIPWAWAKEGVTCPRWEAFVAESFEGRSDATARIAALQEFAGYLLLQHARFKRALVIYGPSDTGKSEVGKLFRAMVGGGRVCSIPLGDMGDPRKVAPIKGKLLNLLSELPRNALVHDGGFKALVSTGDAIQIDEKFKAPLGYVPIAKHVVLTNNLPRIDDHTFAVFRRLLILSFENIVPKEKQDPDLEKAFLQEMVGILAWAVSGARRLVEHQGRFTEPPSSVALVDEYRKEENPLASILEEDGAEMGGQCFTPLKEVRKRLEEYLHRPVTPRQAGELIRGLGYSVEQRWTNGRNQKCGVGFRLRHPFIKHQPGSEVA